MRVVIHESFGNFELPREIAERFKCRTYCDSLYIRTHPALFEYCERHENEDIELKIVELPDDITDFYIKDYDGCEDIIYVKDGLLYETDSEKTKIIGTREYLNE